MTNPAVNNDGGVADGCFCGSRRGSVGSLGVAGKAAGCLEFREEIMSERHGDAAKQLSVNASFTQNFIDVGSVTANLLRQPGGGAALTAQFIADKGPDVDLNATFFGRSHNRL